MEYVNKNEFALGSPADTQKEKTAEKSDNEKSDSAEAEKDYFESISRIQKDFFKAMDPSYIKTVTMSELYETAYLSKPPIIEGLLYPGTYLFVGAPKVGKSFLMAQIAYHVSTGQPLWGNNVKEGKVLYLALEDNFSRLQKRLYRMFGTEKSDNLYLSVSAKNLGSGLFDQLENFINNNPETSLIIIDTLQKVRESEGDKYSYANDYVVIARLKKFSDKHGICLLLVHHTRKQNSDDKFDMISGTNGLLGAADGAFLLQKEKRTSSNATLLKSAREAEKTPPLNQSQKSKSDRKKDRFD